MRGDPDVGVIRCGGRWGQAVHQPGDDAPAGRAHRLRIQVQAQRIGGGHGRHDHLEPLERQRSGRQRGLRAPAHLQRGGRRLPRGGGHSLAGPEAGPRPVGELAGPQQLGHVLEGAAGGEPGRIEAAVAQPAGRDLGDGRLDRDVHDTGRAPRPAPPGQLLHLVGIEQAAAAIGGLVPVQQAAADVSVERRGLHTEPASRLAGGQELGHPASTGLVEGMVMRAPRIRSV